MQSKFLFFLFFITVCVFASPTPICKIVNRESSSGEVVKIVLTVNSAKKDANISWKDYDRFFSASKEIILLDVKSMQKSGVYYHEITFTSVDAQKIKIPRLTFFVDQKKYQTKDIVVNFRASNLPSKLHDIKPNITQNWTSIIGTFCIVLFFIFIIFISLKTIYHLLKYRFEVQNSRKQEQYYSERLATFQLDAASSGFDPNVSINTLTELIEKYILTLENAPERHRCLQSDDYRVHKNQLLNLVNRIKFLPNSLLLEQYPSFIASLTVFMNLTSAKE